jgi:hypothetical protein
MFWIQTLLPRSCVVEFNRLIFIKWASDIISKWTELENRHIQLVKRVINIFKCWNFKKQDVREFGSYYRNNRNVSNRMVINTIVHSQMVLYNFTDQKMGLNHTFIGAMNHTNLTYINVFVLFSDVSVITQCAEST